METRVSDLQLAAYLMAFDYPLLRVEGSYRRQVWVFEVPEGIVMNYYRGVDKTSARKLFNAHKDLKGMLMHNMRANS
jgi:hypothetical protein